MQLSPSQSAGRQHLPTLRHETGETLRLAVPMIIGQLGQMLINLTDTVILGHLGVTPLATSAFINNLLYLPMMIGMGLSIAVSVKVSQARGSDEPEKAKSSLVHGLWLSGLAGTITLLAAWMLIPHLGLFRQPRDVIVSAPVFFLILSGSMIPMMMSLAVKSHADAMNRPWPVFWISLGGVLINILLNWLLVFGKFGLPMLGLTGSAVATLIARSLSLIGMVAWCRWDDQMKNWAPQQWFQRPTPSGAVELLKTAIPSSLQLLAEVSAFVAASLLIGTMGEEALASHQIALQAAATIFMVPLGISMALTVRMGAASGAGEWKKLRPILLSGWLLGIGFSVVTAIGFQILRTPIAMIFTSEPHVIRMASQLLMVAGFFQLSDAIQVTSAGALRGLDDVKVPAWIGFCAYWLFSIPFGKVLAIDFHWGVSGMWWGITSGLTITAVLLGRRIWKRTAIHS
jgi:multidrug resistance protein, MATE family